MQDLIVLCADQHANLGLKALLTRGATLGFRAIDFKVVRHLNRDNGVFQQAHDFLRSQHKLFAHALAVCDFEGCGKEGQNPREKIESLIEQRLQANGWANRAAAIVIQPELESWVWGDWEILAAYVSWPGGKASLRSWLEERGWIALGELKPRRAKESLERVLRQINRHSSSSLFAAIGRTAETTSCVDPAFRKLLLKLRKWFPVESNVS